MLLKQLMNYLKAQGLIKPTIMRDKQNNSMFQDDNFGQG